MGMIICKRGDKGTKVRTVQRLLKLMPDGVFGTLTEEAVREFQNKKGLTADGIVGIATWQKLLGCALQPSKRTIKEIIVHCTATREGKDYTVEDIRRWHKQQGWSDIGYHYVVYRNGHVEQGRDADIVGAHCTGHNTHSIGVAYIGGTDSQGRGKDTRTAEQKAALEDLLADLRRLYPDARIHGHRDFTAKDCPSFDATREYAAI